MKIFKSNKYDAYYWIDGDFLIKQPIEKGDQTINTDDGYPVDMSLLPEKEQDELNHIKRKLMPDKQRLAHELADELMRQDLTLDELENDMSTHYDMQDYIGNELPDATDPEIEAIIGKAFIIARNNS